VTDELNFVQKARREKLEELVARGVEPFAYSFHRTHFTRDAFDLLLEDSAEGATLRVVCLIVAWRTHGKMMFSHLLDVMCFIQHYFR